MPSLPYSVVVPFIDNPEAIMTLLQTWIDLFPEADLGTTLQYWRQFLSQYSEEHREYHGIAHPEHMWEAQEYYFPDLNSLEARAVRIGTAFHDWFNHPFGVQDEQRSAEAAELILPQLKVDAPLIKMVSLMVLGTANHSSSLYPGAVLCDLDLLSLGSQPHIYQAGTAKIHREYVTNCGVAEALWVRGRRGFIERFLGRERIYQTDRMYSLFEVAARHNLEAERDSLPAD